MIGGRECDRSRMRMILEIMLMLRMLTELIGMMLTFAIRRHIFYQGFFRH